MVGRDGFFIKVTLKYTEYFHVTYRRTETHCISNDLFSGVKKFPCLLYYLEVLEVVTVAYWHYFCDSIVYCVNIKKKKLYNTQRKWFESVEHFMYKGWKWLFYRIKGIIFVQQIHFFPTQEILTLKNLLNVEMFLKNVKYYKMNVFA